MSRAATAVAVEVDALDLLHGLVLEDGRRWGQVATDVQRRDAEQILDLSTAVPYSWMGRARGYSKSTDLGGVALAVLLRQAPPGSKSYAVAADQDQARLLLDALEGFVRRSPELRRLVEIQATKIVVRRGGATLEALPADQAGAWGLRPFFVVVDELAQWATTSGARRIFDALMTAMPKTGGRLAVATTAGDPAHWSARIREHALADPLWRVSEVSGAPPWMPEVLIDEQRRRLPDSSFRRLFGNEWLSGEDRLVSAEDLAACITLDGPVDPVAGMRYATGVDVGLKKDKTAVCVCHLEHGVVWLDRIAVWQGSRLRPVKLAEVEEWILEASRRYPGPIIVDPWQAAGMVQRLKARGVNISEYPFTAQSIGRIASNLYTLLREQALRLPDDPELRDELLNVRLRETSPGVLRLDHDASKHDDRAVSLALACHKLVTRGEVRYGSSTSPAQVDAGRTYTRSSSLVDRERERYGLLRGGVPEILAGFGIGSWQGGP